MARMDDGRVAARGFQYQYVRTLEALLAATGHPAVHGCRIEGPVDSTSASAIDLVDFDLVDQDGTCLLAAQVKSAAPGRQVSAPEAFVILVELVCKVDAEAYELITAAVPDHNCRALAQAPADPATSPEELREVLAGPLKRATGGPGPACGLVRAGDDPALPSRRGLRSPGHGWHSSGPARTVASAPQPPPGWSGRPFGRPGRRVPHRRDHAPGGRTPGIVLGDRRLRSGPVARRQRSGQGPGTAELGHRLRPAPPVPDVVRSALLTSIADALASTEPGTPRGPSCVLSGLSGIGKSSAATAFIADQADQYDLVLWVEATTEESLASSFRRIWGHLNRQSHDTGHAASTPYLREQVHELLSALPGRWLIVFDDASPRTVDAWVPRLGRGHVLFTSIDNAGWTHLTHRVDIGPMDHAQAMEMLRRRLAVTDQAVAAHQESLDALATSLEGWPLAIELACGYIRSCNIPLQHLDHYRSMLLDRALDDERSIPAGYPHTLVATVSLILERLAQNTAGPGYFPHQVREVLGFMCTLDSQRIPVHLALAAAFITPDIVPASPGPVALDEATVPVREIIRALIEVSFVRYDEPLPALFPQFPGHDDTVSMNTVLHQLLRQRFERGSKVHEGLSRCAFHTERWLTTALDSEDADRAWTLAPHAAALAQHIQDKEVKDNYTALLIGNLARFEQIRGQPHRASELLHLELAWLQEIDDPNELLIAQARLNLAELNAHDESPTATEQSVVLLTLLLDYLKRLAQDDDARNAAALLATKALVLLQHLARQHPDDPRLQPSLDAYTMLTAQLPRTPAVTEVLQTHRLAQLYSDGDVKAVEQAARNLLATPQSLDSFHTAEVQRHLIEALAHQHHWTEAEAEFERFLAYTGPRSLYRSSVQDFVHNVRWQP
ncbi:hypothetical protein CTZ27_37450 [Streptomyces griseocarneus]|nr:hypothetical protein CTZ27_37450 [Streptomyces griseocarneus]